MDDVTELQKLHRRWRRKTGEEMPEDIARQPIDMIRKAVKWCERGITIAIPKSVESMAEVTADSMMEWDEER